MNPNDKKQLLKDLLKPGAKITKPRSGGEFVEIQPDVFREIWGGERKFTLSELQAMPGQELGISLMPIVFPDLKQLSEETAGLEIMPYVTETEVQGKILPCIRLYSLSPLTASEAFKLIQTPKQ